MMTKLVRWSCDREGCETPPIERTSYGMPDGWHWYLLDGQLSHACQACSEAMQDGPWGISKTDPKQLTDRPGQFIPKGPNP